MFTQEPAVEFTVWPTWVGLAVDIGGILTEPTDPNYRRGQIYWRMENGQIVGGGGVTAPPGEYHALIYAHTPTGPCLPGSIRLPHPMPVTHTQIVEVDPITHGNKITGGEHRYRR